jgi:hypothetical protein
MKTIYLVKDNGSVRVFYSQAEMIAAGFSAADKTVTEADFNGNGCYARIIGGAIVVGMTDDEKAVQEKSRRIAEIKARLEEIDRLDGPRQIREAVSQMADNAGIDTSYLMTHEEQARTLRQELAELMTA